MSIPPRQIGWSEKENLLWNISKQLDRMICLACNITLIPITTTTTTTNSLDGELLSNEEGDILLTNEDGQEIILNE